jgi:hypothetical protein
MTDYDPDDDDFCCDDCLVEASLVQEDGSLCPRT